MKKIIILLSILILTSCETISSFKMGKSIKPSESTTYSETAEMINGKEAKKLFVGLLVPLSGNYANIGDMLLKSAQLSMFNNKNNNIIIIPYDTKGTAFGAVEAMNSAVRDGIEIVVGPLFTESTKAILDIASLNNLIVISLSDNQALLNSRGANKLYLMGLTPKQEIDRIISYLIDTEEFYGFSAMFLNDSYGNSALNSFKEVIARKDAKIVKTEFYSKNDKFLERKVNSVLNSYAIKDEVYKKYEEDKVLAKAQGLTEKVEFLVKEDDKIFSNALLIPSSDANLLKIGQIVKGSNVKNKPILIGTNRWLNNSLYTNINFNEALFVAPNPNNYLKFEELFFKNFNQNPYRAASLSYDAITAVIEAFENIENKEDLQKSLENQRGFDGINGRFRFIHDGSMERKLSVIKIINGRFEIIDNDNSDFLNY